MERLPRGQKIKIRFGNGRWDRCAFAGASEDFLYCASGDESGYVPEWKVNWLNITDFKLDHDVRNGRLIFTAVTVGSGLALGIHSSLTSGPYNATANGVLGGLIGAGLGALVAAPLSCVSGHCVSLPNLDVGPPGYGVGVSLPLRRVGSHARR